MNEQNQKNEDKKVDSKVAFSEMKEYLKKHKKKDFRRGKISDDKIKEDYIDCIEAIEDGRLSFNEHGNAVYELIEPLYKDAANKALVKPTVNFRSRVKQIDRLNIMDNIDPEKKKGSYVKQLLCLGSRLSVTELELLEDDDYAVVEQICSVF